VLWECLENTIFTNSLVVTVDVAKVIDYTKNTSQQQTCDIATQLLMIFKNIKYKQSKIRKVNIL